MTALDPRACCDELCRDLDNDGGCLNLHCPCHNNIVGRAKA